MQVVATIIAIEQRRSMADRLFAEVTAALPERSAIFYASPPYNDRNAILNARNALEFAASVRSDWHLFLEDDQVLYPAFWDVLPKLLELGTAHDVEAFYLSNRKITYASQELIGDVVMNRIVQPVHGAHGLLYRSRNIQTWLCGMQGDTAIPVDDTFWRAVDPIQGALVYQIVAPILAQASIAIASSGTSGI